MGCAAISFKLVEKGWSMAALCRALLGVPAVRYWKQGVLDLIDQ